MRGGKVELPRLSASPSHLEGQLHEDDAPRQCPLQVVGGDWSTGALKNGKGDTCWGLPAWNQHAKVL